MSRRGSIEYQKLTIATRRAGEGANEETVAAYCLAPTLADELAGQYSAELLRALNDNLPKVPPWLTPMPVNPAALKKLERVHKLAAPAGAGIGLLSGSLIFGAYDPPTGFLLGLLVPGGLLAVLMPRVCQQLVITRTRVGRQSLAMAYGVHLRTQQTAAHWQSLTWREFERDVGDVFRRLKFRVDHTGRGGDEGVDLVAERDGTKLLIQCKKYGKPVGPAVVRELVGTLVLQKGEWAILVSSSGFTGAAADAARGVRVLLLDVYDLLQIQKRGSLAGYLPGTGY